MILIHFTDNPEIDFFEIRKNDLANGFLEMRYHYVIEPDGKLLMGRHQSQVGAHYPQFDEVSVGICVVGKRDAINEKQNLALTLLLDKLQKDYPDVQSIKYIYRTD